MSIERYDKLQLVQNISNVNVAENISQVNVAATETQTPHTKFTVHHSHVCTHRLIETETAVTFNLDAVSGLPMTLTFFNPDLEKRFQFFPILTWQVSLKSFH